MTDSDSDWAGVEQYIARRKRRQRQMIYATAGLIAIWVVVFQVL